jgi:sulfur carrier protein
MFLLLFEISRLFRISDFGFRVFTMTAHIIANGKAMDIALPCSVAEFIERQGLKPQIVIVEYNGEPLRREQFAQTALKDGDKIEVVRIVAGG